MAMMSILNFAGVRAKRLLCLSVISASALLAWTSALAVGDPANGKILYAQAPPGLTLTASCAASSCHGANAAGRPSTLGAVKTSGLGSTIVSFYSKMPVITNVWSAQQLDDIAAYVKNPTVVVSSGPATAGVTASLSFSSTSIGVASAAQPITLTNTAVAGSAALTYNSVSSNNAQFSVAGSTCNAGGTIAAGSSCNIAVTFTPNAAGAQSAVISVSTSVGTSTTNVSGTGAGSAAASASTNTITFPDTPVNATSAASSVRVTNGGSAALTFGTFAFSGGQSGEFALPSGSTCTQNGSLAAGASCDISVAFTPQASGGRASTLVINNAVGALNVTVSGKGTAGLASVSPAAISFGSVQQFSPSNAQTVTFSNAGSAPLTISSVVVAGTNFADFAAPSNCNPNTVINAGTGSCSTQITFTPAGIGPRTASLVINHSLGSTTVPLDGTGTAVLTSTIGLNTNMLDYLSVTNGATSPAKIITVSNSGQADLILSAITPTSTPAGAFALTSPAGGCVVGTAIRPAATCTVNVTFAPNQLAAFVGSIAIASNASNGAVSVGLKGTGAATPAPIITVSPTTIGFGTLNIGTTANTSSATITNSGNAAATLGFSTPGSNFSQSATTCTNNLPGGSSCSVSYTYKPTTVSTDNASVAITTNAPGTFAIALSGTGTNAPTANPGLSSSADYDFGPLTTGVTSTAYSVNATNTGTAAFTVSSISVDNTQDFTLGGTCVNSASVLTTPCTITVVFKPTAVGLRKGIVRLVTNGNTTLSFNVLGTGNAPASTSGALTPTPLNLGSIVVGAKSAVASKTTLANTGNQPLDITSVTIAAPFSLLTDPNGVTSCKAPPFTLAVGATCDFAVIFTPTVTGNVSGSLVVATKSPGPASLTTALSATGTAAPTGASVTSGTLSMANIDFGSIQVGTSSASVAKTRLDNIGNQILKITAITLTAGFSIDAANTTCGVAPFDLAVGANCDLAVKFTPSSLAAATGSLTVTTLSPGPAALKTTLKGLGTTAPTPVTPPVVTPGAPSTPSTSVTTGTTPAAPNTTPPATGGTPPIAIDPNAATTPFNVGKGGCSMAEDGRDASLVLLLIGATATAFIRRRKNVPARSSVNS
jgi:mono/diheme cytochrome c family protein